jgi:citrate synthase
MTSFSNQMNFVRERQQIKYEIKLMMVEDILSLNLLKKQKIEEEQRRLEEEQRRLEEERRRLEEEQRKEYEKMQQIQLKLEKKQMQKFIDDFVIKELNKRKGEMLDLSTLKEIALNEYYNRKLIEQQDEEYNLCVQMDLQKMCVGGMGGYDGMN